MNVYPFNIIESQPAFHWFEPLRAPIPDDRQEVASPVHMAYTYKFPQFRFVRSRVLFRKRGGDVEIDFDSPDTRFDNTHIANVEQSMFVYMNQCGESDRALVHKRVSIISIATEAVAKDTRATTHTNE